MKCRLEHMEHRLKSIISQNQKCLEVVQQFRPDCDKMSIQNVEAFHHMFDYYTCDELKTLTKEDLLNPGLPETVRKLKLYLYSIVDFVKELRSCTEDERKTFLQKHITEYGIKFLSESDVEYAHTCGLI